MFQSVVCTNHISRGEDQKGVSDIFGEMDIYIYIKWKLLISSFYRQKYCNPSWEYNFVLETNEISTQSQIKFEFCLSCKVGEMSPVCLCGSLPSFYSISDNASLIGCTAFDLKNKRNLSPLFQKLNSYLFCYLKYGQVYTVVFPCYYW